MVFLFPTLSSEGLTTPNAVDLCLLWPSSQSPSPPSTSPLWSKPTLMCLSGPSKKEQVIGTQYRGNILANDSITANASKDTPHDLVIVPCPCHPHCEKPPAPHLFIISILGWKLLLGVTRFFPLKICYLGVITPITRVTKITRVITLGVTYFCGAPKHYPGNKNYPNITPVLYAM
jgi:hypothetical protein